MPTEAGETTLSEKRLFSDQLMLEMGLALVDRGLVARDQVNHLISRKALTGENLQELIAAQPHQRHRDLDEPFLHLQDAVKNYVTQSGAEQDETE